MKRRVGNFRVEFHVFDLRDDIAHRQRVLNGFEWKNKSADGAKIAEGFRHGQSYFAVVLRLERIASDDEK